VNTAIEVYPWDLEDEGIDTVLARISGDLGADTVTVGAILPETHSIRRRATSGPRVIRMPSGAHFQPDGRFYAGTRIRPVTTPWLRQRNPLERIARRVADHRLNLRIRLACCDVPALVEKYPMAGTIDVFGEPHGNRLCPSNPDVRAYLIAVVEDLCENYKPVAIELDCLGILDRGPAAKSFPWAADATPLESLLLELCFCPACRERGESAGLDVNSTASDVLTELETQFRREADPSAKTFIQTLRDLPIGAYHQCQSDAWKPLFGQMREHLHGRLILRDSDLRRPFNLRNNDSSASGFLITSPGAFADAISILDNGPIPPPEELNRSTLRPKELRRVEVRFRTMDGHTRYDGQSLVRLVKEASDRGHPLVEFTDYGSTSEPALEWIRQAIRFAKRG